MIYIIENQSFKTFLLRLFRGLKKVKSVVIIQSQKFTQVSNILRFYILEILTVLLVKHLNGFKISS